MASEVQEQNFCISKQACDTGNLSTRSGTLLVAGHLQVGDRVLTPCRVTLVELLPLVRADRKLGLWKGYRLNLSNRRRNRRVRGGSQSRSLDPRSGTRGLWSISISMCLPIMKSANFSQAHVVARASFSIWAY